MIVEDNGCAYRQGARRDTRREGGRERRMIQTPGRVEGIAQLSSSPRAGIPSRCLFRENDWTRFRVSCPPLFRPLATPARFCPLESRQLSPETRPISIFFAVGDMSLPFPPTFSRSITEIPDVPPRPRHFPRSVQDFRLPTESFLLDATRRFRVSCIFYTFSSHFFTLLSVWHLWETLKVIFTPVVK